LTCNLIKTPPLFFTGRKLRPPGIGIEATGALKTRDWKTRNWKTRHQITEVENAGPENGGTSKLWKAVAVEDVQHS